MKFSAWTLPLMLETVYAASNTQTPLQGNSQEKTRTFIDTSIFAPQVRSTSNDPIPDPIPPTFFMHDTHDPLSLAPIGTIDTFAGLPFINCFAPSSNSTFDIALIGAPFDLGVTYRPGARFGPTGARLGARRLHASSGWDMDHPTNAFTSWPKVVDCGDIYNTPFDKLVALKMMEDAWRAVNAQAPKNESVSDAVRIISIGGDHTITLPILRALHSVWGKVAVLHFDSHLDTWDPKQLGGGVSKYAEVNHGTMLHIAHEEGLLSENSNMHLGSRCALYDKHYDLDNDARCGFNYITARSLDKLGIDKVVERIVERVGDQNVYLSVDIDVLDPAFAPATGTIEPGGWTTRELLEILDGLSRAGVKIIGADVVEFTPVYDNVAETTGIAVAQIVYEILQWMVHVPVRRP